MQFTLEFFGPTGPLAKLPGYEDRDEQKRMAQLVNEVFQSGHIGLVEAGTGTGKSLAYLYPALCHAKAKREKVVISTNTINLQEQLITKDIPFLKSLGLEFSAVVVKGWGNYPCLLRIDEQIELADDQGEPPLITLKQQVLSQAVQTKSQVQGSGLPEWEEIAAEPDLCARNNCPFIDQCPVFTSKRLAEKADILIVNHHLLLADVSIRRERGWDDSAVLPSYRHVVFDEAHHVEEVATSYFGTAMSSRRLTRFFGLFYRKHGRKDRGVLSAIRQRLFLAAVEEEVKQKLLKILDWQLLPGIREGQDCAVAFFQSLDGLVGAGEPLRIKSESAYDNPALFAAYDKLYQVLDKFAANLRALLGIVEQLDDPVQQDILPLTGFRPYLSRAEALLSELDFLLSVKDSDHVYWLERKGKTKQPVLAAAPISVGDYLRDDFFFQLKSAVFTSATLTVDNSFDYYLSTIGIDSREWQVSTEIIPSPFDYAKQALLAVPTDLPYPDAQDFSHQIGDSLASLMELTGGRAFILFTSYALMQKVATILSNKLVPEGFTLFVQGNQGRNVLLNSFRQQPKAILLGTDSFWEGVDVPGEALSCVVLTRLPFRVPKDPVVEARVERIEAVGGNSFYDFFLPQAVIKFRQGFGRLIRRKSDRGVVLIYDRRIIDKAYGKYFLKSLPKMRLHHEKSEQLNQEVAKWLQS